MEYVMGKKVSKILRQTFNGHFVTELVDHIGFVGLGFGLPDHVGIIRNADEMIALVNAANNMDSDEFETYIESLYMSKLVGFPV